MTTKYSALALVTAVAAAVMLAQSLVAQAPAPAAQGAPGAAPGGAGRGGGGGRGGGAPAAPAGPVVRTADGRPDFTGYWNFPTRTNINSGAANMGIVNPETGMPGAKIPYKPEWEAKSVNENKNHLYNEPYTHCLPAGVPTNFGIQMGFQAVQDKNAIVFGWDTGGATRVIYLDGRKHIHPSIKLYQGDSIGKFEGDVLTVDTTNQMAGWWDATGAVHSDQVHVVEKFTFRDSNTIAYEAVVTDPVALTRPMTVVGNFTRNMNVPLGFRGRPGGLFAGHSGYEQTETACVEGEQDLEKYPVSGGGRAIESPNVGANAPPGALQPPGGGRGGGAGGGARGGAPGAPGGAPPQQ
jgi:hypothetical protein